VSPGSIIGILTGSGDIFERMFLMACMEHFCCGCGHTFFNNRSAAFACPKCGWEVIISTCDEKDED
jgi:predicted RNA-binding Zn-ribbon protein involved in translation (DUF1610 family)